ncbi:MAG TPA: hypothetical protein VHP38_08990 [Ruminiclostridium sp.]|nr:hypothetical protein [Ruminiclostridium sp.]
MAKEDALRFMVIKEKDTEIKSAFDSLMGKYEGKNLSKDEWVKVIQKEVIPFANKYGYDFTSEDLAELQKAKMSDEELDQVVGGRGQFTQTNTYQTMFGTISNTYTMACDLAPDDQTFTARFHQGPSLDCPDYVYIGRGCHLRACMSCAHLQTY